MRSFAIASLLALLAIALIPARAQSTFGVGFFEFENVIASMTYTGTWSTSSSPGLAGVSRSTSALGASVSFYSSGDTVVIWRLMRSTGNLSKMDVCVNGSSCINVANEFTSTSNIWYSYAFSVPPGALISITLTSGLIALDSFMILNSATGSFPTAVPTATILPSPTPASTTTPQPTPTPQPTSTPMSVIVAIDPSRSYGSSNGQITAFDYAASAADVHLANLLTMLLVSVWGFFLFGVLVLVKYRINQ